MRRPESESSLENEMKRRQDSMIRCPYYKGEERQQIFCEGVEEGTAIRLGFDTTTHLKEYKAEHCKDCWKRCGIAEMNNRKWDYE